jgi:ATP-dependent DNA ligase
MMNFYPQKPLLISLDQPLFKELELRENVVAEPKYNGTRLILKRVLSLADFVKGGYQSGSSVYEFWNRDGELLKYNPSKELLDQLDQIKWQGDCVLDGELLHFKTTKIKHTVVLFDALVWNKELIIEKPFSERRLLLQSVKERECFKELTKNVFLAPQWKGGIAGEFLSVYNALIQCDEIEGIVIKSLSKPHKLGRKESPVVPYDWKVRKPGPSYRGGKEWRHDND